MNKRKKLLVVTLSIVFILLLIGSYFLLNRHEQLVCPGYDDIKVPEGTEKAYVSLVNPVFNQASFKQ